MLARIVVGMSILGAGLSASGIATAQSSPWSWGIGLVGSEDIYADYDSRVIPVPMIVYSGDRLRLFGPYVSYDIFRPGDVTVSALLNPVFSGYKAADSPVLEGMDTRHYSMAAGVGVTYRPGRWAVTTDVVHDVLGINEGYESSASLSYVFPLATILVEPSIGLIYQSENYVDYYYGVREDEVRDGRPAYSPGSNINQEISLTFITNRIAGGSTRLQLTRTTYGSEVTDSPLTSGKHSFGVNLLFGRAF